MWKFTKFGQWLQAVGAPILLIVELVSTSVSATTTYAWKNQNFSDFYNGQLQNVEISSLGYLQSIPVLQDFILEKTDTIMASVKVNNALYLGTAGPASITKFDLGKHTFSKVKTFEEAAVTSLVRVGDFLYAAVVPSGKIVKMNLENDRVTEWVTLADPYIWEMVAASEEELLAATGPKGELISIDISSQKTSVKYDTHDEHITALAYDKKEDTTYLGTSQSGLLIRLDKKGKAFVLNDFAEREVKDIILHDGKIFCATNEFFMTLKEELEKLPELEVVSPEGAPEETIGGHEGRNPALEPPRTKYSFSLYVVGSGGRIEKIFLSTDEYVNRLAVDHAGLVYLSTSPKGRVYKVDSEKREFFTHRDFQAYGATFIIDRGKDKSPIFTSSGPAAIYAPVESKPAPEAISFTSKILDAQYTSLFGRFDFMSDSGIGFWARSGNVSKPGDGWSDWKPIPHRGFDAALPNARFFQWKAVWNESWKKIFSTEIFYRNINQRPIIKSVRVDGLGTDVGAGASDPTFQNTNTSTVRALIPTYIDAKHENKKTIAWDIEDINNDRISIDLFYAEAQENPLWRPLSKNAEANKPFTWNTENYSDGRYLVKIVATDAPDNAPGEELSNWLISDPFTIDNQRPDITDVTIGPSTIRFVATDALSKIVRAEVLGEEVRWRLINPDDGLFDSKEEKITLAIDTDMRKKNLATVRVIDSEDNSTVKNIVINK
jgi:hypothetical protein